MSDKSDDVKIAAYGSWSSPITSEMAVQGGGFTGLTSSPLAEVHTCVNDNNEGIARFLDCSVQSSTQYRLSKNHLSSLDILSNEPCQQPLSYETTRVASKAIK